MLFKTLPVDMKEHLSLVYLWKSERSLFGAEVETEALLEPFIFEKTATERGSISAEHGIGFWKKNDIHYSQSPESVALMRKLKHMFDPAGILNPYKLVA